MHHTRMKYLAYFVLALCVGFHGYLSVFAAPPPNARFDLSPTALFALRFSFLPLSWAAWWFGLRSVIALHEFADKFHTPNPSFAKGFHYIGYGLLALTINLVLGAVLGGMRNVFGLNSVTSQWITVAVNYLYVVFPLIGLSFVFAGARLVTRSQATLRPILSRFRDDLIIALSFSTIVTILYGLLVFTNPHRQVSLDLAIRPTYFISDSLIFFTLVIPSFAVWLVGMLAAFEIDRFAPEALTPKQQLARRRLVNGIWAVIFSSISVQVILALGGARLLSFGLAFILYAVYFVILFLAFAYYLVMRGARGFLEGGGDTGGSFADVTRDGRGVVAVK